MSGATWRNTLTAEQHERLVHDTRDERNAAVGAGAIARVVQLNHLLAALDMCQPGGCVLPSPDMPDVAAWFEAHDAFVVHETPEHMDGLLATEEEGR